ncbi:MAG: hypothetical protein JRI68_18565 [Deltaproteobacteria bacterium]|nr:hypothetical protein [Deltaproteobacteria bacterium]
MSAPKNCPQCAAPTTGAANCAYCGARILEIPTEEYIADLRAFMKRHDRDIGQHYSPWMWVALLITLGGPVAGYFAGSTYDWPWVTAIGVFLAGCTWFCIAIGHADARYAKRKFLPELLELLARKGYSVAVAKNTAQAELDETRAEELLKVVEKL